MLLVKGQDGRDDLHFVQEAFGEEGANGAVDEAGRQRVALGRLAFAFEKAARDFAGSEVFFLIVDGEGEEVLSGPQRAGGDGGDEDRGFAVSDVNSAICLSCHFAGLDRQLFAGPVHFLLGNRKHSFFLFKLTPLQTSW